MKLSVSVNVAVERERTKWKKEVIELKAQVTSLEDEELELESKCETFGEELSTAKADLASLEEDAKDSIAWAIKNDRAKLALAVYAKKVSVDQCKEISDDYLADGSIAELLDNVEMIGAATAESSSPGQDKVRLTEETRVAGDVVPEAKAKNDEVVQENPEDINMPVITPVTAEAVDQEVSQDLGKAT